MSRRSKRAAPGETSLEKYGFESSPSKDGKRLKTIEEKTNQNNKRKASQTVDDAKMDEGETEQDLTVQADDNSTIAQSKHPIEHQINIERIRTLNEKDELVSVDENTIQSIKQTLHENDKCILYWMQRDQRIRDNWALAFANQMQSLNQTLKNSSQQVHNIPLIVAFCLPSQFLNGTDRGFQYLMSGLKVVESKLRELMIPFYLLIGTAPEKIVELVETGVSIAEPAVETSSNVKTEARTTDQPDTKWKHDVSKQSIGLVITDFNPLRIHIGWRASVAKRLRALGVPMLTVDAHNIVPVWKASDKLEYGARTIRGKIHRLLPQFLTEFPNLEPTNIVINKIRSINMPSLVDWEAADASLQTDRSVMVPEWINKMGAGEDAAMRQLHSFLKSKLSKFADDRNNPILDVASHMSIFLHFGAISPARCVIEAQKFRSSGNRVSIDSFIEEIVVRRELADNFCYYEPRYDTVDCAKDWAQASLKAHEKDERQFLYTLGEFEMGVTHDPLWNAAQLQMTETGKMHGFLRMYWAKCMLAWSVNARQAQDFAIFLNDRYEMDGREPNGYVGIAWSILGIHDQGWPERPVFGKIRCMNYNGCKRKFDVDRFVNQFPAARPASKGFKINQQKAKELDEMRSKDPKFAIVR